MKKILTILALAASMQLANAQQGSVKSVSAAKAAYDKAAAAVENAKQNTKTATWIKYGQTLLDAYNAPAGAAWLGMSRQDLTLLGGGEKPVSEEQVTLGGKEYTKVAFANKNLYFAADGVLNIIEVTQPVVENALEKAVEAYTKAAELDDKGQKTKEINAALKTVVSKYIDEAYNSYTFGDYSKASVLFEKAANLSESKLIGETNDDAVYNAAFTAWSAGELERAKSLFERCLSTGNQGEGGEVYAKLADIAEKLGDNVARKNYLEEGFSKNPESQSILVGLINYYLSSKEDTTRLFELLDQAKKNDPKNASLYYVEGNIHNQLGNGDKAVEAYNKCAEIDPNYEHGYIGLGLYYYNLAVDLQEKASQEVDDAKYMALLGEFETALKACIEPFEKAFEITKTPDTKVGVAEYLKNACYRFRTTSAEYQEKYDKYAAASAQ